MQDKMLYLLRGLPGSGKSTLAKTLAGETGYHFEADQYFELEKLDNQGKRVMDYNWNPEKIYDAHKWCQAATDCWMGHGVRVIVSNTFTTEKELKPYLALAEKHGYSVTSIIVEGRHGNKSVHDVPDETIEKMRNRFSVKL